MPSLSRRFAAPWCLVASWLLSACGESTAPGMVMVTSPQTQISIGGTVQLTATVTNSTGAVIPGGEITWTSDEPTVASVSPSGLVAGLSGGTARITATTRGVSGSIDVTVLGQACSAGTTEGAIAVGDAVQGTLAASDCILLGGPFADGYVLTLTAPIVLQVDLTSTAFNTLVRVTDQSMNVLAVDNDGGEGTNARLIAEAEPGTYIVWATSFQPGSTGAYELSVAEAPPACTADDVSGDIGAGDDVTGSLGADDCRFVHGGRAQGRRLTVSELVTLQIDLTSAAFDAVVVVTDTLMNIVAVDDDSGEGTNSRLVQTFTQGEYYVWVTPFNISGSGSYQLSIMTVSAPTCTLQTLEVEATVDGSLASTDCRQYTLWYADIFEFNPQTTITLRLDLMSDDFNAFLVVTDANLDILAEDDDGGTGTDSRVVFTFTPGKYIVWASSFEDFETGSYQLSAQEVAGVADAGEGSAESVSGNLLRHGDSFGRMWDLKSVTRPDWLSGRPDKGSR